MGAHDDMSGMSAGDAYERGRTDERSAMGGSIIQGILDHLGKIEGAINVLTKAVQDGYSQEARSRLWEIRKCDLEREHRMQKREASGDPE